MKKLLYTTSFILAVACAFAQSLVIDNGATVTVDGDGNGGTILDVNGDVIINGDLDLVSDATLILSGDFEVNRSDNPFLTGFTAGNSTVIFDGASAQEITSASLTGLFEFFYNITIDNPTTVSIDATAFTLLSLDNILDPRQGTFNSNDVARLRAQSNLYARVAAGNGNTSGDFIVEKRLSNTNEGWRHMALPVSKAWGSAGWSGISLLFDGHTPANQINVKSWNSSPSGTADYAFGWQDADGSAALGFTNPYAVYLNTNNAIHTVNQVFSCKGPLSTILKDQAWTLDFTRAPEDLSGSNPDAKGWNFKANIWAALIDVQALLSDASFEPAYKAVHVYNSVIGAYQAILLDNTVTKIPYNTTGPDIDDADANIPPFQGFWVKADQVNQGIAITSATMQTTAFKNTLNEQFMKKRPELIRLNVFDQDSLWDQLVVYFDLGKTREFDDVGDAYFLRSQRETTPIFYGMEDGSKASIIGRPLNETDSVQVVFGSTKEQSKFHVHADLDELGEGWHVYLRDKESNETYQLDHDQSLSFSHFNGLATNRFVVYFSKQENAFNHLVTDEQQEIISFIRNEELILQSKGVQGPATISVYDATGRLLDRMQTEIRLGEETVLEMDRTNQLVVIQITAAGQVFNNKVFY